MILDADVILQNLDQIRATEGLTVNGTLTIASAPNPTGINFDGPQTLGGTGELVFAGTGFSSYVTATGALTISAGFTIHGRSGVVVTSRVPLINQGTIVADTADEIIEIQGLPFTNKGTVEGRNGGVITLKESWRNEGLFKLAQSTFNFGGNFSTPGLGTIQRNGGTINLRGVLENTNAVLALNAATGPMILDGGTIHAGNITSDVGAGLRLKTGTLDGVTLDTDFTLENLDQIQVSGGLTVNKTLTIASSPSHTGLSFLEGQTVGGSGQIVFGGTGFLNYLSIPGQLTIAPGFTIRGRSGAIVSSGAGLINEGNIVADVPDEVIEIQTSFTNKGTVEARNGGVISLKGAWANQGTFKIDRSPFKLGGVFNTAGLGTIRRDGGTIHLIGVLNNTNSTLALASAPGLWMLDNGTIRGGKITSSDSTNIELKSGLLDGVTLDLDVTLRDLDQIRTINGLTVNGILTIASLLNPAGISFEGAQTLGGTGQIVFGGTGSQNYLSPNAALTIGPALTIHGREGMLGAPNIPLTNQGFIIADVANETITVRGTPFTNTGSTTSLNGGKLLFAP